MRGHAAISVLVAAAALSACTLFTSLDDLSGPQGDASDGSDGGVDARVESSAGPDGLATEAGGRFCASVPANVFCADFDDGPLPGPFDPSTRGKATVALDGDALSPPSAALFSVRDGSGVQGASLRRALPPVLAEITIDLDFRVDERTTSNDDFDLITISSGDPEMGVQLNPDGSLAWDEDFADGSQGPETPLGAGVSFGSAWTHLRWTSRIQGAVAVTELRLDGTLVGTHSFEAAALVDKPVFILGDDYMDSPVGTWRVRVDNVTIDAR